MPQVVHLPLLDSVRIAAPCSARWEEMTGDERVRHCAQCDLDVHNLSAMTLDEAEGVLQGLAKGRVCARFFRRADGTILTQDCPVGVARVRRAARRAILRVAALIGLVGATGFAAAASSATWGGRMRLRAMKPFSLVCEWIAPGAPPAPVATGAALMGDVCITPRSPPPRSAQPLGAGGGQ
jgi:hypothetical protein